jgi:hypothetical protein
MTALLHAYEMGESTFTGVAKTVGSTNRPYMDIAGFDRLSKMQSQQTAGGFP